MLGKHPRLAWTGRPKSPVLVCGGQHRNRGLGHLGRRAQILWGMEERLIDLDGFVKCVEVDFEDRTRVARLRMRVESSISMRLMDTGGGPQLRRLCRRLWKMTNPFYSVVVR